MDGPRGRPSSSPSCCRAAAVISGGRAGQSLHEGPGPFARAVRAGRDSEWPGPAVAAVTTLVSLANECPPLVRAVPCPAIGPCRALGVAGRRRPVTTPTLKSAAPTGQGRVNTRLWGFCCCFWPVSVEGAGQGFCLALCTIATAWRMYCTGARAWGRAHWFIGLARPAVASIRYTTRWTGRSFSRGGSSTVNFGPRHFVSQYFIAVASTRKERQERGMESRVSSRIDFGHTPCVATSQTLCPVVEQMAYTLTGRRGRRHCMSLLARKADTDTSTGEEEEEVLGGVGVLADAPRPLRSAQGVGRCDLHTT